MSGPSPEVFGYPVVKLPETAAVSPETAITYLIQKIVESGRLRPEHAARVIGQVLHREARGSTAIAPGVAVPHARSDVVETVAGVVGHWAPGIPWPAAVDGAPVSKVCLLVAPASQPCEALLALENIAKALRGQAESTRP